MCLSIYAIFVSGAKKEKHCKECFISPTCVMKSDGGRKVMGERKTQDAPSDVLLYNAMVLQNW